MKWIKCEEKLPPVGEKVLLYGMSGGLMVGELHNNKLNYFKVAGKGYVNARYWIPIPKIEEV